MFRDSLVFSTIDIKITRIERRSSDILCEINQIDILQETLSKKKELKNPHQDLVWKSRSKRSKQKI